MAKTVNNVARGIINVIVVSVKVFGWDFAIAEVDQLVQVIDGMMPNGLKL